MASHSNQRYTPVPPIPTYDEAIASGSHPPPTSHGPYDRPSESESHSLLPNVDRSHASQPLTGLRRPLRGYQPPTVETDDEASSHWTDSEADEVETAHVRREMQEFETMEAELGEQSRASRWGKRIPFSFSLPQWRWRWQWRLPRFRIRLSNPPDAGENSRTSNDNTPPAPGPWCRCPSPQNTQSLLLIARVLAIITIMGFIYLLFASDLFSNMARRVGQQMFDPESLRLHMLGSVNPDRLRDRLRHFTRYAHLAGSEGDFTLTLDTRILFENYGLKGIVVDEYHVYMNYATEGGRAVEILGKDGDEVIWSADLEEVEKGHESAGRQTWAFHGHSQSGDVKGPLVYANYGSRDDFQMLRDRGIDTTGAIALVRHSSVPSDAAHKVKAAELAGFAGCIIYSDPAQGGFVLEDSESGQPILPADEVQRGSVSLTSWLVGDVLTPGWESKETLPRLKPGQSTGLVHIPSIPLSWRDAQVLLQHLQGSGIRPPVEWVGAVPEVSEWWTGNASSPIVHLKNDQDVVEKKPIWNVYGRIEGIEQASKSIIIGNHRDSWTFGAASPHSGTAIMMELANILGDLARRGWRPSRTIEFMSWDGGAFNLAGSTEFVEKELDRLQADGFAYINLDQVVTGPDFHAAGSPVFRRLLLQVLNRIDDPHLNTTVRNLWESRGAPLEGLAASSDYVAFQDLAGVSSLDLGFRGAAFPQHSNYDTFEWMDKIGDPSFVHHTMMTQIVGLLVLELSDRPLLPFDVVTYADSLRTWIDDLQNWYEKKVPLEGGKRAVDLNVVREAGNELALAIRDAEKWARTWEEAIMSSGGWEPNSLGHSRMEYNSRIARLETNLLDLEKDGGIPNRTQYKHVIFGPQLWSSHEPAFFPAIRDTIEAGDWVLAQTTVERTARVLRQAATGLRES